MNRDPQPENRDPQLPNEYIFMGRTVYKNTCHKCKGGFDTLNPARIICAECVHKASLELDEPNNPTK